MKRFHDMKIRTKLLGSFLVVAAIVLVVGVLGMVNLNKLAESDAEMYQNMTVPISQLNGISTAFQRSRVNLLTMVTSDDPQEIQKNADNLYQRQKEVDELSTNYEKLIVSDDMQKTFDAFLAARKVYGAEFDKVVALSEQNKDAEALILLSETGSTGVASRAE